MSRSCPGPMSDEQKAALEEFNSQLDKMGKHLCSVRPGLFLGEVVDAFCAESTTSHSESRASADRQEARSGGASGSSSEAKKEGKR
jgi:hypothetical protein